MRAAWVALVGSLALAAPAFAAAPDIGDAHWEPDCSFASEARETPEGREALWRERSRAEPLCLLAGATAWSKIDRARAERLYAVALVRRRYDTGRCVRPPQGSMAEIMALIRIRAEEALEAAGSTGPSRALMGEVVADPATYSYRTDHLVTACGGQRVRPQRAWPAVQAQIAREFEAAR
jgi:hypothetical protein